MQLRVLVVDDHEDLLDDCKARFRDRSDLVLDCAQSRDEALLQMRRHVYDVIFVDLQLDTTRPMLLEGEDVLDYAARHQRLAVLYAWTAYPGLESTCTLIIESLLNPDDPIASQLCGLIDKTRFAADEQALAIAEAVASQRLSNPVRLDSAKLGSVLNRLAEGRSVDAWLEPLEIEDSARIEELHHVVSRLFGQGTDAGPRSIEREVEIDFFDELAAQGDEAHTGHSGATVFLARVRASQGMVGEWVVVKVGSKLDVLGEAGRYERYVRYDRAAKHRVELLGHQIGNTIAAIAYSLAGPDPQRSQTVRASIKVQDPLALSVIGTLFSAEWKHWHAITLEPSNPMRFMQQEFRFRFNDRLRQFVDGVRAAATWRTKQGKPWWTTDQERSLRTDDLPELLLPGEHLNNQLSTNVPFSICHGDSHAANIICTTDGLPRLIDYAATGPGPRALDFVVFEASHRVIEADALDMDTCGRRMLAEQELWDEVWGQEVLTSEVAAEIVSGRSVFWERLSATVLTRFRRSFADASAAEYARVAVLHGVRLAPVWWVDDSKSSSKRRKACTRVRLASWMAPMIATLQRPDSFGRSARPTDA